MHFRTLRYICKVVGLDLIRFKLLFQTQRRIKFRLKMGNSIYCIVQHHDISSGIAAWLVIQLSVWIAKEPLFSLLSCSDLCGMNAAVEMTGWVVVQLFIILTRSFAHPISNAHLFSLGAADRLFVTPLWLPGIDHFPVQVTVSPLSTLSRRLCGTGKEFSIPTRQLVSRACSSPFRQTFWLLF